LERDLQLYYWMKLTREFEDRVSKLHRQSKIQGGVYSGRGQEAVVVGTCADLKTEDVIFPLHRDLGAFLVKGADPRRLMAQMLGKEAGFSRGKDSALHAGDPAHGIIGSTSMLGSTLPVACGQALKFKIKKEPFLTVAYFGEGASSRGDVHEAMNFAGVHKLPVIFVCENNQYAYSTPLNLQMAIDDVADRAEGYGFVGEACNGNDLGVVLEHAQRAFKRARAGEGPTLLELKTYRISGHSEHDPAVYRKAGELQQWADKDPIHRWEAHLQSLGRDVPKIRTEIETECQRVVNDAAAYAEAAPEPVASQVLEDLYA
jgi:TPP-dependent pyruvate/acetoin dehydrogenase alpha subunit